MNEKNPYLAVFSFPFGLVQQGKVNEKTGLDPLD